MYKTITNNLLFYSSLLVAFLMPLSHKITVYAIMLFVLSWLLSGQWLHNAKFAIKNSVFIILVTFFLLHLIGLLYSSNMHAGWFDIEVKLTMILFPLVFFLSDFLNEQKRKSVLLTFVTGTTLAMFVCIGAAFYEYFVNNVNNFFYMKLSVFHHPTYFAMYICFSLAIILKYLFYNESEISNFLKSLFVVLILLFGVFIYMLSSKAGIIIFFITLAAMSLPALFNKSKRLFASIVLFFAVFQIWFSLTQNMRFETVSKSVATAEQNVTTAESNGVRVLIYEAAIYIIKSNYAIGVGTGDIKDELLLEYKVLNMKGAFDNKLNAHSQFLETFIGQGIAGISLLLLLFLIPFINSIKTKNWLLMTFVFIVALNFLTESMLNTQAGVVFFAFFYSFFVASKGSKLLNA
ncbi:MAG: O-antigen ligase family protein [Bacteroidia bacterium]|nr:O-antigen ligase family protein [Bacteroidia bacterium]